ncbi:MAG: right-handed parallel beta-helix repeat-containing protein [Planctomycetes bacterium]|nr:right-handed parallel beta-helix repeat-containing protein [Planctomycetota bacterium]MCB9868583.1 right-handed parallel beta-helix repeat-containing protein [Planctomycetota bacterium]
MRSPRRAIPPAVLSLIACLGSLTAQGKVWVVDAAGGAGADTRTIEDAVLRAGDGDVLLVRQGSYGVVKSANKALTIVRDTSSGAATLLTLTIDSLALGKNFTVRGFTMSSSIVLVDCQGSVSIEDCTVNLLSGSVFNAHRCRAITLSRCAFTGSTVPGLWAYQSQVSAFDSTFTGGAGTHGLLVWYSQITATGCTFQGGRGAPGVVLNGACYVQPQAAGNGVDLVHGTVELHGCTTLAGAGAPANGPCPSGPAGVAVRNGAGTLIRTQLTPLRYTASATVREGQPFQLDAQGASGDNALLVLNLTHDSVALPGCTGALFPSLAGHSLIFVGILQGTPWQLRGTAPTMAPGLDQIRLATQLAVLRRSACVFGPAASVVLLDQRF